MLRNGILAPRYKQAHTYTHLTQDIEFQVRNPSSILQNYILHAHGVKGGDCQLTISIAYHVSSFHGYLERQE